ncbi:MAG: cyclic-di-AMP receptor [Lachnospiraceae bacterium]|nr:cyclic-di-AMP receptor [Lachnospiraceae bacterium]
MKIIYAIVSSDDGNRVTDVLNENQFSVTKLATTGGFLKKGNATLMIGTDEARVDEAIGLIRKTCGKRQKISCDMPTPNIGSMSTGYMMMPVTVELGGATIFVTDVERFEKF